MTALLPFAVMLTCIIVSLVAVAAFRQIARASVAGHVPGAGSLAGGGRAGDRKSITDSTGKSAADSDRLRFKRELLEQWAKEGRPIDTVAEARAELVVLEVEDRANAWRDFTAAAVDEPVEAERPFAS